MSQQHTIGTHKTTVHTDIDRITHVVYHETAVVSFDRCFEPPWIRLDSGGYQTAATKTRMNQTSSQFNLGYRVFQKKHVWYVEYKGNTHEFHDGMILTADSVEEIEWMEA